MRIFIERYIANPKGGAKKGSMGPQSTGPARAYVTSPTVAG